VVRRPGAGPRSAGRGGRLVRRSGADPVGRPRTTLPRPCRRVPGQAPSGATRCFGARLSAPLRMRPACGSSRRRSSP
jgi:hypothetical protein